LIVCGPRAGHGLNIFQTPCNINSDGELTAEAFRVIGQGTASARRRTRCILVTAAASTAGAVDLGPAHRSQCRQIVS
jgi:hypothetical protein